MYSIAKLCEILNVRFGFKLGYVDATYIDTSNTFINLNIFRFSSL